MLHFHGVFSCDCSFTKAFLLILCMLKLTPLCWELFSETTRPFPIIWRRICLFPREWSTALWMLRLNSTQWVLFQYSVAGWKQQKKVSNKDPWKKKILLQAWRNFKLENTKRAGNVKSKHLEYNVLANDFLQHAFKANARISFGTLR